MFNSIRIAATAGPRRMAARPFTNTAARYSAVKPGSESEATTPGAGSTEDISHSSGAYDGSSTNPDTSTNQIEQEKDVNFKKSSANKETSEMATKGEMGQQSTRRPSKQQQSKPDREDLGATEARKQGGRGGQKQ